LSWGSGFLLLTLISASIFWKQKNRINSQKLVVESQNKLVKSMHEEIHHRTKNNLLKINDFIAKKEKDYPVFSKELTNSVNSMLFVHTQLLDHPDKNEIDMQTYFQDISNHLVQTYQEEDKLISCNIDAPIWMDNKKAQHIGLILNELLTNTHKYAFPNKKNGNIMITMEQKDHQIVMAYRDDGIGLPQDFNIMNLHSFGLKMVQGIVCQLDGTLDILNNENGFALKITLNI
jgi:two-component sensor histidine kinase